MVLLLIAVMRAWWDFSHIPIYDIGKRCGCSGFHYRLKRRIIYSYYLFIASTNNISNPITANNPILIQIGDKTQNQLQEMYPVSFSPMNKIVSSPTNPIHPEFEDSVFIILKS